MTASIPSIARGTQIAQKTFAARRFLGLADRSAQSDDMDIPEYPVILGKHFHQIPFYLLRVFITGKSQFARYPFDMSIHDYTGYIVDIPADHIGSLASHTR